MGSAGFSQEDRVLGIAKDIWCKQQARRRRKEKFEGAVRKRKCEDRRADYELEAVSKLFDELRSGQTLSVEDVLVRLPKHWARFFMKHEPRQKYDTDSSWIAAITETIGDLWEQLVDIRFTSPKVGKEFCDPAVVAAELAFEERLDAKIDKAVVSLGRMKTMQQIGLGRRRVGIAN